MEKYIEKAMTFADYEKLIDDLLAENKTTGLNQSEAMVGYARLNRQRMVRLKKTIDLDETVRAYIQANPRRMIWLIITEGWCGDAAQTIPVIEKIAAESDKIKTRYILRDGNPELIDLFLTRGARSTPKLIALDAETLEVLGSWGSRPQAAQDLFSKMKADGTEKAVILEEIQRWYNADKGLSLQHEFVELIAEWNAKERAAVAN
ncbi:MAG: thioredoxin family protein [Acidobacteria bacterium]|nr:thioredoxin family protein [Acidobacteriota bacterium]MBP7473897.1 thioredoxin family protein [Pyrinomonadaceae bacterium]MBP9110803.1 thioredoxin family protein [Pyrinomonadaceae bacterium]